MKRAIDLVDNLEDLIKIREGAFLSNQNNDFNFNSILAGLYKDPTHFIFELLQNAEDVGAKTVSIELREDTLIFYHDSKNNFSFKDVKSVTGIGQSTKANELNKIGKFGIGFKSVFAITDTPFIYSGDYSLKIENFYVPRQIDNNINYNHGTTIVLPFNHKTRSKENVFNLVESALRKLDTKVLLFLRNIESINWRTPTESGSHNKEIKKVDGVEGCHIIHLPFEGEHYMLFERCLSFKDDLFVAVAYKLIFDDKDIFEKKILAESNSKLSVYFATETVTFLNFIINGPFCTTPTRESIPEDNTENHTILEEVADLYAESIRTLKKLSMLNVDVLNILPINSDLCKDSFIYKKMYEVTRQLLGTENLLPTFIDGLQAAKNTVLARGADLTDLLLEEDLRQLFSAKYWLSTDITANRTPQLRKYLLDELNVTEVTFEGFCRLIDKEFLALKDDEWFKLYYKSILNHRDLTKPNGLLRSKPIIRTVTDQHIQPYINETINAYLPSENITASNTVKHSLLQDKEVFEFFELIGLKKADIIDDLRQNVLLRFSVNNPKLKQDEYIGLLKTIINSYLSMSNEDKKKFLGVLNNYFIILAEDTKNESLILMKPTNVYMKNDDLFQLYNGYSEVYFISSKLLDSLKDHPGADEFLRYCGILHAPKIVNEKFLTTQEKIELRADTSKTYEQEHNFTLEGLNFVLDNITIQRSVALWRFLNTFDRGLFFGFYEWWYSHSYNKKEMPAGFVKKLASSRWLLNKNNEWRAPNKMIVNDLSNSYGQMKSTHLVSLLEFQPDIYAKLEPEIREKLKLIENVPIEILKSLTEQFRVFNTTNINERLIEEKSSNGDIKILDWDFDKEPRDILNISPNKHKPEVEQEIASIFEKNIIIKTVTNEKKLLGKWGEEKVMETIEAEFIEEGYEIVSIDGNSFSAILDEDMIQVQYMNSIHDVQKGYDILKLNHGEVIEYIEVKTKENFEKELLYISGVQWELARELFDAGSGNLYSIYVVYDADPAPIITRYNNPYKAWIEGKLYAHPVQLKL